MLFFLKPDPENAQAVYDALAEFGAPLDGLTAADFREPGSYFRMGNPPLMIDLLLDVTGIEFDQAWANRVEAVVDSETGLTAYFLSRADLIAAKLASGRPQDIADVAALRQSSPRE